MIKASNFKYKRCKNLEQYGTAEIEIEIEVDQSYTLFSQISDTFKIIEKSFNRLESSLVKQENESK